MKVADPQAYNYIYYGTKAKADELIAFIQHVIRVNLKAEQEGKKRTPICIWGRHGIGKTEIVETIARENGYSFVYIAPAQFEEMGDLLGMPAIEGGRTVFRAPAWVPDEEGPGILLIDDVNRADDRILRGIMQLLQNFELVSWKLPPKWQIILTANPDGGDYSVTPMDDAILTRMMHISMEFDVKEWARWAEKNGVDERGINFLLTYPEIVTGKRTTPRTLVQFFEAVSGIDDLAANLGLVQILGDSCLDEQAVAGFIAFVQQDLAKLPSPEEILNARNFNDEVTLPLREMVEKETRRVDILATLSTRLANFLIARDIQPDKRQVDNIRAFIHLDFLPNDLRLALATDLAASPNKHLREIMKDPDIGRLLLDKM
jgi:hypothetical protein